MSLLNVPAQTAPAAVLPTMQGAGTALWVYDGLPDEQAWLDQAVSQARVCAPLRDAEQLEAYVQEAQGAPLGVYNETSTRVARVVGLMVDTTPDETEMDGVGVAHGRVSAYWEQSQEGRFLVVEFQEPSCVGWGAAKNGLCQEQLKVRCMRQYEAQCRSLLEHASDLEWAHSVQVRFVGLWDESTELIRRNLSKATVTHWAQLRWSTLLAA